jgi:hypothetical protein
MAYQSGSFCDVKRRPLLWKIVAAGLPPLAGVRIGLEALIALKSSLGSD